jgi:hypothetical protein
LSPGKNQFTQKFVKAHHFFYIPLHPFTKHPFHNSKSGHTFARNRPIIDFEKLSGFIPLCLIIGLGDLQRHVGCHKGTFTSPPDVAGCLRMTRVLAVKSVKKVKVNYLAGYDPNRPIYWAGCLKLRSAK